MQIGHHPTVSLPSRVVESDHAIDGTGGTRWTQRATFARKRNDIALAAGVAIHADHAVREAAATLIFVKFIDDESRIATARCAACRGIGEQRRAMFAHDAMQCGGIWAAALIARRLGAASGRARCIRCARALCRGWQRCRSCDAIAAGIHGERITTLRASGRISSVAPPHVNLAPQLSGNVQQRDTAVRISDKPDTAEAIRSKPAQAIRMALAPQLSSSKVPAGRGVGLRFVLIMAVHSPLMRIIVFRPLLLLGRT